VRVRFLDPRDRRIPQRIAEGVTESLKQKGSGLRSNVILYLLYLSSGLGRLCTGALVALQAESCYCEPW
jgi:hypothetical protein